jgi:hypothetical protein
MSRKEDRRPWHPFDANRGDIKVTAILNTLRLMALATKVSAALAHLQ